MYLVMHFDACQIFRPTIDDCLRMSQIPDKWLSYALFVVVAELWLTHTNPNREENQVALRLCSTVYATF
jgi:hypothetical protein